MIDTSMKLWYALTVVDTFLIIKKYLYLSLGEHSVVIFGINSILNR